MPKPRPTLYNPPLSLVPPNQAVRLTLVISVDKYYIVFASLGPILKRNLWQRIHILKIDVYPILVPLKYTTYKAHSMHTQRAHNRHSPRIHRTLNAHTTDTQRAHTQPIFAYRHIIMMTM